MKAPIDIEVTRDLVVSLLVAHLKQANPSALVSLVAQAMDRAATELDTAKNPDRDNEASWLWTLASRLHAMDSTLRDDEDRVLRDGHL